MQLKGFIKRGMYTFYVEHDGSEFMGDEMVYVECSDCRQRERFALEFEADDQIVDDWMIAHVKTPCVHCGYCAADGKHEDCEADAVDVFARFDSVEAK